MRRRHQGHPMGEPNQGHPIKEGRQRPRRPLGDARLRLWLLLCVTVATFGTGSVWAASLLAAGSLGACAASGMDRRQLGRALRPAAVVLALVLAANALVADATGDLTILGPLGVSWGGLAHGAMAALRIGGLVGWCAALAACTSANDLADALASFLRPLSRWGAPVDSWAMLGALTLRFVPDCADALGQVRDAQRSRGVPLDDGPLPRRLRAWSAVLVPWVVAMFRHGRHVAEAMDDRCWGEASWVRERRPLGAAGWLLAGLGLAGAVALCLVR